MADSKQLIIDLILENDKMKKTLAQTEKVSKISFDRIKKNALTITAGLAASFISLKKSFDFTKEFAAFQQASQATKKQYGLDANEIISQLDKVANGTISNTDLILSANKLMALGVTNDVGEMSKILEVARVRGQALGLDTATAFSDLAVGIGRASPLILDNLGIVVKGWAEQAKAAGVAYDSQFILNKVLEDGATLLEKTGEVQETAAERTQAIASAFDNAKVSLGESLLPVFETFLPIVKNLLTGFGSMPKTMKVIGAAAFAIVPAFIALNAALGPIGLAITGIAVAAALAVGHLNNIKMAQDEFAKSVEGTREALRHEVAMLEYKEKELKREEALLRGRNKISQLIAKKRIAALKEEILLSKKSTIELEKKLKQQEAELKITQKQAKEKERINSLSEEEQELLDALLKAEKNSDENRLKRLEALRENILLKEEEVALIDKEIASLKEQSEVIEETGDIAEQAGFDFKQFGNAALTAGQNVGEAFKKAKEVSADAKSTGAQNANAIVAIIFAIIAIVEQVGKSMEVAGEKMRKWGDDADTSFGNFVSGLGKASSAVGGHFKAMADGAKKGVPPLLNTFLSIKGQIEENNEAVKNSASELESTLKDMTREVERQAFASRLAVVNEAEKTALDLARVTSGLKGIEDAEKAKRKEDLIKSIAETTDAEKKADLQLQLDKIIALEKYAAEEKRIRDEAEEQRKQIKREEYEYEKALRQIDLDSSYSTALMDSESIFGKNNRAEAQARITKAYQANTAALNSLEPPAFEEGGVIKGLNDSRSMEDGFIQAQNGESVLNKNATAVLGEDAINALNSGRGLVPSSVVINVADGTGAVEMLDQYFKTNGTSTRGLLI